jgi:DnaJ domain
MSWLWGSENISVMSLNAALLALWPVLPVFVICYVRQFLIARRTRPVFALRKSEADELHRARRLFGRVRERIDRISQQTEPRTGFWRFARALAPDEAAANGDEMDDLHAHAQHLQATIRRLTRLPLQRLDYWVHVKSSQFACGVAIAAHIAALALLLALFHVFEQSAWARHLAADANRGAWYPFDERIFQANAVAAAYACMAATLFYVVRRALLRRAYSLEFSFFRQFAKIGPAQAGDQPEYENAADAPANGTGASSISDDGDWIAVLGVSAQATINEVKNAYKILIKKKHPDRVQDMSPAFRTLAEAETRKINAAYRQALLSVEAV